MKYNMKQRHTSSLDIDESSTTNISLHNVNDVDGTNVDPSPLLSSSSDLARQLSIPTSDDCVLDVHSPTWRHPIQSSKTYFVELSHYFGWEFLSWLAINQCCVSGGVFALVSALGLPLFKELGIDAARQQLYMSLVMSPWAMKPFIGVLSDLMPIRGYNKRYFALYSILIGLVGCSVLLGMYPNSSSVDQAKEDGTVQNLADIIVLCFTAVSYEAATLDILGEGKYAELMRLHPESGSSIISFKFGWSLLGGIFTQAYVGPLSDAGYFHVLFWMALALSLTPFFPTLCGWIPEKLRTVSEPGMIKLCKGFLFDRGTFLEKKSPFIVITLCGLSAPLLAALTTYCDLAIGLSFAIALIVMFTVATYKIFPKSFFWIFLSIVLNSMSWISIGSALGYYYTASEECVPDGPNFDYTFYITVTGIVGSIVNFFAVILYQNYLSSWRFRPALIFTVIIGSLASIIDVIIIKRYNVAIGIPDKIFFLFGNAVFENLIVILNAIPMSAIYAKISPPRMESAVFAYTVGIANFCGMVSTLLGSGVIEYSGMITVKPDDGECDFTALPWLIVIFQIFVPMVIGIPCVFLIPNVLQTEKLIDWDKEEWYKSNDVRADESVNETEDIDDTDNSRQEPRLIT